MKHSIRVRLILILTVLTVSSILLVWFMNRFFLTTYYESTKIDSMGDVYSQAHAIINELNNKNEEITNDTAAYQKLQSISQNNGVSLYYFYCDFSDNLYDPIKLIFPNYGEPAPDHLKEFLIAAGTNKSLGKNWRLMKETDDYYMFKVYDNHIGSNYIELVCKRLDDQYRGIYIRSNYQSMQESVRISNKFLAYIGLFVTILGIIFMYFFGKKFTKPITELSTLATRMSNLDFGAKYKVNRQDEIGVLGNSMNALSEKLEHTILELKTANNELQTDIERKIQIDEMRQEFLSNVSHELKTPIALIQGYAEGLQDNINDDQESREFYCEVIIDEADKMNKMVKKLLSLNQIEFGTNQVNFEHFDIVSVIQSVLSSVDIMVKQKNVTLEFEQNEPIYVWADEFMIEEVITNYVSNALNHVKEPNIIRIDCVSQNDIVRISVFNTGDSIPEDELDKIWIKFYKVDKARTREYGGNGIGLSIVKAIMTSMNRDFGVQNKADGVEFWFELDVKNE